MVYYIGCEVNQIFGNIFIKLVNLQHNFIIIIKYIQLK